MGMFYEHQRVVNRAPDAISIRFDGQELTLKPGEGSIPRIAVPFGKNQNPIMGSQDPNNPHISGADYLLAVVGEDNCTPLTAEEWATHLGKPCRLDEQAAFQERYGGDPKAKLVTQGRGKRTAATSRSDASEGPKGLATFEGDR